MCRAVLAQEQRLAPLAPADRAALQTLGEAVVRFESASEAVGLTQLEQLAQQILSPLIPWFPHAAFSSPGPAAPSPLAGPAVPSPLADARRYSVWLRLGRRRLFAVGY